MTTQKYHPMADYDSALEGVLEDTSRLIIKQEVEILEAAVQVNNIQLSSSSSSSSSEYEEDVKKLVV